MTGADVARRVAGHAATAWDRTERALDGVDVRRETFVWGGAFVAAFLALTALYQVTSDNRLANPLPVVVPMVWIGVGAWALVRTDPPAAPERERTIAVAVAATYFGLLGYFGGLWGVNPDGLPSSTRLVLEAPPGWSPALLVTWAFLSISVVPYLLVGYVALSYLVYATVLDAWGSAVPGVLGLFSCVSCTWPIVATVASAVLGTGTGLAAASGQALYPLSTVVFVATVGLLHWRPGWE